MTLTTNHLVIFLLPFHLHFVAVVGSSGKRIDVVSGLSQSAAAVVAIVKASRGNAALAFHVPDLAVEYMRDPDELRASIRNGRFRELMMLPYVREIPLSSTLVLSMTRTHPLMLVQTKHLAFFPDGRAEKLRMESSLRDMRILGLLRIVAALEFTVDARRRTQGEHANLWRLHRTANERLRSVPPVDPIEFEADLFQNSSGTKICTTGNTMQVDPLKRRIPETAGFQVCFN